MRFIVRPNDASAERIRAFRDTYGPIIRSLGNVGDLRPVPFMQAFSLEVPDTSVIDWRGSILGFERNLNVTIRPAHPIYPIAPIANAGSPALPGKDPEPRIPDSLAAIGVRPLWDLPLSGKDINVGVIDEAFGTHPSLPDSKTSRYSYDPGSKKFAPGKPQASDRISEHGTFAAALIAGEPINNVRIAVAPEAHLHLVALPDIKFEDDVALAFEFLSVDKSCKVISISLGTWEPTQDLETAVQMTRRSGALVVAAVGNESKGVARWPAACESALSVGACDDHGVVVQSSGSTHFDRKVNPIVPLVVAPGVMLTSANVLGGSSQKNGTSVAAPLVAGLAALLFSDSRSPHVMPDDVEMAIVSTCSRRPDYEERCAYGMPNGPAALNYLRAIKMC